MGITGNELIQVSQGPTNVKTPPLAATRQSADQGDAQAQFNLGLMYDLGQGVPEDDAEAVAWYRKAADQGVAGAQYTLGLLYTYGLGVPRDYVEAHKWHDLAISRVTGDELERYVETLDAVAMWMTPARFAEARKRADEWQAAFEKRQAD